MFALDTTPTDVKEWVRDITRKKFKFLKFKEKLRDSKLYNMNSRQQLVDYVCNPKPNQKSARLWFKENTIWKFTQVIATAKGH